MFWAACQRHAGGGDDDAEGDAAAAEAVAALGLGADGKNVELALRLVDKTELDATPGYRPGPDFMQSTAEQALRFFDSKLYFNERSFNLLLMALQDNQQDIRRAYYETVRSCRRRRQRPISQTALAKVFTTPDEYHLLQVRAGAGNA